MSVHANRIRDNGRFSSLSNLSFLEELDNNENARVRAIFNEIAQPNPQWRREIEEVRPWVQTMYEKLAEIFGLIVIWDTRRGDAQDKNYADHYLTHPEW